jgi:hypothetical protein
MLEESAKAHKLEVKVIKKARSCGIVPTQPTIYEVRACVRWSGSLPLSRAETLHPKPYVRACDRVPRLNPERNP